VLPTVVMLEPAPEGFPNAWIFDVAQLGEKTAERPGPDARHLIVRSKAGDLRLCLRGDSLNQPLAIVLPLDDDFRTRAKAALRFWACLTGRASNDADEPLPLTRQQRDRLVLILRALDGHLSDASYREIAEDLFGARHVEYEAWKTSSLRDRTIRLVRSGVALMRAGYRRILRGR
jgi:hypothetical protein